MAERRPLYHNRGNTTFAGENSFYGDFFGLDDLFTEHPRVVDGMIDIYSTWIRDFRIDGFRIDTMKHVDDEFWRRFAPAIQATARSVGKDEFYAFGEVFDQTKQYTSHFTTQDDVQGVLDFPFQAAAQDFAARSASAAKLGDFFRDDDWYTDADSNVYQLPTFLGNHDMGRFGLFVRQGNPGAGDAEVVARDRLGHELMYFSRGNPVIYYGDEQGFAGDGGDQLARQDMFPSQVPAYNDDDLIGTDATTAQANFDRSHPLYRAIARLADVTREHRALRDGAHQHRYAADGPGIYAFSRLARGEQHEYVVALNNAESEQTASIPTWIPTRHVHARLRRRPAGAAQRRRRAPAGHGATALGGGLPLGAAHPGEPAAPSVAIAAPAEGGSGRDRLEVRADVGGGSFYEVTFEARVGSGDWQVVGTDDNAPYRVFHDVSRLTPGTALQYRATVLDNDRNQRTSDVRSAAVAPPALTLEAPREEGRVRGRGRGPRRGDARAGALRRALRAPGRRRRLDDDRHRRLLTGLHRLRRHDRAGRRRAGGLPRDPHLRPRPDGDERQHAHGHGGGHAGDAGHDPLPPDDRHDYSQWGLHLFGAALAPGEATAEWTTPRRSRAPTASAPFTSSTSPTTRSRSASSSTAGRRTTRTSRTPTPTASSCRWSARTST